MKKIETEILIQARPKEVWEVLTDFKDYSRWNPFIREIDGDKAAGGRLNVRIHPPGGKGMSFQPEVLKFDPPHEFRWKGKLIIPGIFDGEHYFQLYPKGENATHFVHGEVFSGILVGLFAGILAKTEMGFKQMNEALKASCEK